MESGKTVLVALISAASTYAAMTAWPAIKELAQPELSGAAGAALPFQTSVLPTATTISNAPSMNSASQRTVFPASASAPSRQHGVASADQDQSPSRLPAVNWDYSRLKFARITVVLRTKPGGEALKPVSLNRAPLTVLRG